MGGGEASLTPAELVSMSAEVAFTPYLAVRVTSGEMIPKKPDETKLHKSYEVCCGAVIVVMFDKFFTTAQTSIRILPFEELADRAALDYESYRPLQAVPRVRVLLTFSAYIFLKENLEGLKVFSRDTPGASSSDKVAVIDAPFPRNYAKSSMGMHLSDSEYAHRIAVLNVWMGTLMQLYPTLPGPAQDCINAFFELATQIPNPNQNAVFMKMYEL